MSGAAILEELDEAECLRLIAPGGVGRLAFAGVFDLTVLPVSYLVHEGAIVFRTAAEGTTEEDLRTGISHAEYRVAFEVDDIDPHALVGWSVLVQGPAHHMDTEAEQAEARALGIETWAEGEQDHFIKITPAEVAGRRVRRRPAGGA
ncbi:MAG TPA: pyridoxamine 5'-phosphate oxidase family protein [Streptosporangiaceae bacterium]|nr:pyridoxamine 5'-phosphate oxidase family protein [Streptosporangiaceae bacterium]